MILTGGRIAEPTNGNGKRDPSIPEPVLLGAVLVVAAVIWSPDVAVFLGSVASSPPLQPIPVQPSQPASTRYQPSNRSTGTTNRGAERLSPELEERLRKCLEEAVKSQSKLLEKAQFLDLTIEPFNVAIDPIKVARYLIDEARQNSGTLSKEQQDSGDPALTLVRDLKKLIEDCDPGLIQKIIEAEDNADSTVVNDFQSVEPQQVREPVIVECCTCGEIVPAPASNCP